ncbi:MAG: hypothetical protein IJ056_01640 [Acidaminococcaceae bacterium]|nr:hypothetical protein [Acidaminococcaceae bacterium]MBQ9634587.1 hypothetical protein [Acidaminococcaceae bacterium]MBQ9634645.1 hypothetical protein [Acidaminococcaceae bacterium]MBQ9698050.1 hypothetical protein [Acidaminococcaceae bacterium]
MVLTETVEDGSGDSGSGNSGAGDNGSETTENSTTFSRASAADVVVEVTDGVIVGLKNNTSNVNADNYTIAEGGGSITIKKEYLSGLADGEKTFHILLEDETDIEYLITVGD